MATAMELYGFCRARKFGRGFWQNSDLRHFKVLAKHIKPTENINMTFMGRHQKAGAELSFFSYCAYAVTDDRIIVAHKSLFSQTIITISRAQINDITLSTGIAEGVIEFDTLKEKFKVHFSKECAQNVMDMLQEVLYGK